MTQAREFVEKDHKGTNDPPDRWMEESLDFLEATKCDPHVDVTILGGVFWGCHAYETVLNARWHKAGVFSGLSNAQRRSLYEDIQPLLPRGGFEAHRFGGSSGRGALTPEVFQFIHHPAALPRAAFGCKFIIAEDGLHCIYNPTKKAKKKEGRSTSQGAVKVKYSQPQRGGAFLCPRWLVDKYPDFYQFAEIKLQTALLLKAINDR